MRTGRFQRRFRGGYRSIHVRNIAGRGHRRLHSVPGYMVRAGGAKAYMGKGQPIRRDARHLVYGHGRSHFPDG